MHELSSVTRRARETLTELYIRIEGIVEQLESLEPTGKEVYSDMFIFIFINVLPEDFSYILTEADMKIPLTVYDQALTFVTSHPSLQLTDVAISKEMSKGIPVNSITSHETPVHQTPTGRNKTYCQRFGLNNHDTQHCRASKYFRCHRFLDIVKFKFHNGADLQSLVSLAACLGTLTDNAEMCHGIHHKAN